MVFLSIPNGKTLCIDVNPNATTISAFEQLVHQRTDFPQSFVRFSLRMRNPSHVLGDSKESDSVLLSDLGVGRFSTVIVHVPLLGGMQGAPPKPRLDFLNSKPPSNYVAGLGRGATGFTTRSDIGPARAAPDLTDRSAAAAAVAPGVGRGAGKPSEADDDEEAEEKGYDENQKFDEFEGNDAGLFSNADYDEDDKEADAIWESIDQKMDSRRKDRREAKLKEEIEKYRASTPKITEQFADLKRKLHTLSAGFMFL